MESESKGVLFRSVLTKLCSFSQVFFYLIFFFFEADELDLLLLFLFQLFSLFLSEEKNLDNERGVPPPKIIFFIFLDANN